MLVDLTKKESIEKLKNVNSLVIDAHGYIPEVRKYINSNIETKYIIIQLIHINNTINGGTFIWFSYLFFIRKVMLTFLIKKRICTQIYYINLAREQIYWKLKFYREY